MKREVSWPAVAMVAAAVVVLSFCGYLLATWPPDPPRAAQPTTENRATAPATTAAQPPTTTPSPSAGPAEGEAVFAVLGDSFTARSEASTGPEWPRILGRSLGSTGFASAVESSGYVSPGEGRPFGERVNTVLRSSPDVIVVAGGVADVGAYPTSQVTVEAEQVVRRLVEQAPEAQVVLVSPFSNGEPGPLTLELTDSLQQVARKNDVAYVDATRWFVAGGSLLAADGVHPTDEGQRLLAQRMEEALTQLGVAEPAGQSAG